MKSKGGGPHMFRGGAVRKARRDAALAAAEARNVRWASLTPREQLAALDKRLGAGAGARKQRARLTRVSS